MTDSVGIGRRDRPTAGGRGQAMAEFALVAPLLLLVIVVIIEAGRFVFLTEIVNNATREGARYAIVHGANSPCPSGPAPPFQENLCDPAGDNVKAAVQRAAIDLMSSGELFVFDPTWINHNGRGQHVTVRVDYSFEPIIERMISSAIGQQTDLLPSLTISAESTLVINN